VASSAGQQEIEKATYKAAACHNKKVGYYIWVACYIKRLLVISIQPFVISAHPFVILTYPFVILTYPFVILTYPFVILTYPFVISTEGRNL